MMVLVMGKPKSGKSDVAESKAVELAAGGDIVYLATMIPLDEDGRKRIEAHRKRREGKGFKTIECGYEICRITDGKKCNDTVCLLECVSNLVGNEMHRDDNALISDSELSDIIADEIEALNEAFRDMVVVTNTFEADPSYSEETLRYIEINDMVNERLILMSDEVIRIPEDFI